MTGAASSTALPSGTGFLDERAKKRAVEAVRAFESHTSAELVVTVKKQARSYREIDLAFGALFSFATLLFLLFSPVDFDTNLMPLDTILAFGVGFGVARLFPSLRRLAIRTEKRRVAVEEAAKAAFYDLGVSKTTGRTGVLVHVSLFEGLVAIISDTGVTAEARQACAEARVALEGALARSDMSAFAATLEALGPRFAPSMARSADDVNELADEVA